MKNKPNVVLFSYNRPRMLREALDNVFSQSEQEFTCWLVDDGSDFPVEDMWREIADERLVLCTSPKITMEERIDPNSSRWQTNVNKVLSYIPKDEWVVYLCDDDLLSPTWLEECKRGFDENENTHLILGETYYFFDGEDYLKDGRKGFLAISAKESDPEFINLWWNCGAFAHRMECYYNENLKWRYGYQDRAHSYDVQYIDDLINAHAGYLIAPSPAVYRREHDNTLSARMGRIEDGWYVKAGGELKLEHIEGLME